VFRYFSQYNSKLKYREENIAKGETVEDILVDARVSIWYQKEEALFEKYADEEAELYFAEEQRIKQ
jgi:ssDNA-binding replication factor A large subunit